MKGSCVLFLLNLKSKFVHFILAQILIVKPKQMQNPFSLHDQLALITGGGTGIGLAIAQKMIEAGARVVITGRRKDVLEEACQQLGPKASWRQHDIADLESTAGVVEEIEKSLGAIDILVNNAGINKKKIITEVETPDFLQVIQTNLNGLFVVTREVAKFMKIRNRGCIISISSMAAMYGLPYVSAYAMSKSAVLGVTRTWAQELAPFGIRVNSIAPGFIYSEMTNTALNSDPERKARVFSRTPMNRMGNPEDIGYGAVYLASPAAGFVTGINLPIDGGNSIGF
jgi:NAD(P)-dependent dehydrogenase (short-subunit alcohol dehydrogenase family)